MSLEQWLRIGWLIRSEPDLAEIQQLIQVVDCDIADAQAEGLSADGKFQHAYDAALQLCMIALRASGYRVPKGAGHHKRGIDSLQHTLGSRCHLAQSKSPGAGPSRSVISHANQPVC